MPSPQDDAIGKARAGALPRREQIAAIEAAGGRYYYTPEQEFDDRNKLMVIDEMKRWVKPGRLLELGYTNDIWTDALLEHGTVDVIEGATNHAERGRRDFAGDDRVTVHHVLFEEYRPFEKYDTVLMAGVIKHVPDDIGLLRQAREWVKPDGVVIGCTPNSRSLHRRLGAYMGLETDPSEHNERDREVFNVHLYDRYTWRAAFLRAGYEVAVNKGIFLKPLSTKQLMYLSTEFDVDRMMEGLRELGEELQDYAWYLMVVAHLPPS
jgi:SAM-dependent methyltransferase